MRGLLFLSPLLFLLSLLIVTAATGGAEYLILHRERKKLRGIAHNWHMHYAPGDRLRLASRVAEQFTLPGAYDVRVRDLMFRTSGNRHEYLFTIEYGTGVVRGKRRRTRVGGFAEAVARANTAPAAAGHLLLGDKELSLAEQYRQLFESMNRTTDAPVAI
jgi:hypothetical protein